MKPVVSNFSRVCKLSILDYLRKLLQFNLDNEADNKATAVSEQLTLKTVVNSEPVLCCKKYCSQCLLPLTTMNKATMKPHTPDFGCPFTGPAIFILRSKTNEERAKIEKDLSQMKIPESDQDGTGRY